MMGFQQPVTTGTLVRDRGESSYSSIYPPPTFLPAPVMPFPTSCMNAPGYSVNFSPQYSPVPMMAPTTPSTSYSPREFLSPLNNSGEISSTPTTPLIMQPVPCTVQEPNISTHLTQNPGLTYQEQINSWKKVRELQMAGGVTDFIPQKMYKPHTTSDIKRYIEQATLDLPIMFWMEGPEECGIPLIDALHSRTRRLQDHDKEVFEGRGPSVSIRLEWPGYRQWSRQIPTKDFKSPPRPINMTKLCRNVAKCIQRFINERQNCDLEDGANPRWRVGGYHNGIRLEDLVLVSLHHVSMGSWQPQLRLRPRLR
ncbi:hypothetical protein AX15_002171 [Amanita polypyramis BW_CC]|nr:hypothetical protein AX15_002171 [Amanita polypyramis BW_CC]